MSQLQAQKLRLAYTRSSHYGGSLPDVNQIGCGLVEFQVSGHQPGGRGLFGCSPLDSPVCFGRAPSTHLWIHPGARGTMGWWNGYSETPEEWCPPSVATPATYPSLRVGGVWRVVGQGPSGSHGGRGLEVSPGAFLYLASQG